MKLKLLDKDANNETWVQIKGVGDIYKIWVQRNEIDGTYEAWI